MLQHKTKQTLTRAGIVCLFLMVCTFGLGAQELVWNTLTEYPQGDRILELAQSSEYQIAFSNTKLYYRKSKDSKWASNYLPNEVSYPNNISFFVSETSGEGATVWQVVNSGTTKGLYYSIDMGSTWEFTSFASPLQATSSFKSYISKQGLIWLFQEGNTQGNVMLYRSIDKGVSYKRHPASSNTPGSIIELEDGSLLVQQEKLYHYTNGLIEEISELPVQRIRAMAGDRNALVVAGDSSIYRCDSVGGVWKELNIDFDITPGKEGVVSILKVSPKGDIALTNANQRNAIILLSKKEGTDEFESRVINTNQDFTQVNFSDNDWLFSNSRGVWTAGADSLQLSSDGMLETKYIRRFAIIQDESEVVYLDVYGDVHYKSIATNSGWNICTPGIRMSERAADTDLKSFSDGKKVLLLNSGVFYTSGVGVEWKKARLPEFVDSSEIRRVDILNNSVFLCADSGILVSRNYGQDYEWFARSSLDFIRNFSAVNDTTVVVFTQDYMCWITPNTRIQNNKPVWGREHSIFHDLEYGYILLMHVNTKNWVVARSKDRTNWSISDTMVGSESLAYHTGSAVAKDGTLYFTTYYGMYRQKSDSYRIEFVDSVEQKGTYGGLQVIGNKLYRAHPRGLFEYTVVPTSIKEQPVPMADLFVYPQPASTQITIAGLTPGSELRVVDMQGCEVYSIKVDESTVAVNSSQFVPGVYTVITNGKSSLFMVQK